MRVLFLVMYHGNQFLNFLFYSVLKIMAETGCDWKYEIVTDFSITAARDNRVNVIYGFIISCSSNGIL